MPAPWRASHKMSKLDSKDYSVRDSTNAVPLSPVATGASGLGDGAGGSGGGGGGNGTEVAIAEGGYRTYKRRWFGLVQLTLMNIVVSWGWLTYAPVASLSSTYFAVPESSINWLSTAFFLSFVFIFPLTILALAHSPRTSLMISSALILIGNWVRYAGSHSRTPTGGQGKFAFAMAGEILIGFAQPFVLAAPTRYSDLWFTNRGRIGATAIMTLANPLGAALGQLIVPFWATKSEHIPDAVLYVSIISTIAALPSFFIPAAPPSPVGPSSTTPKIRLRASLSALRSLELWLVLIPLWVYIGFFNSISSLLNQMLVPYGFTDDEAGIGGAILIVVGLIASAIVSPIVDRTKKFLLTIKIFVPIIGLGYLAFVWMPETKSIVGPYVILAVLGLSSFSLLPIALETLIELSHPLSPAVTSTFAWAGGQLFGAIFVISSDALIAPSDASPPKHMKKALIFQAVIALAAVPLPLCLGLFGRKDKVELRRVRSDEAGARHVENP